MTGPILTLQYHSAVHGKLSGSFFIKRSVCLASDLEPCLYMMYVHHVAVDLLHSQYGDRVAMYADVFYQADSVAVMALTTNSLHPAPLLFVKSTAR